MVLLKNTLAGIAVVPVLLGIYVVAWLYSEGNYVHLTFVPQAVVSLGPGAVSAYLWLVRHWLVLTLAGVTFGTAFHLEFRRASRPLAGSH